MSSQYSQYDNEKPENLANYEWLQPFDSTPQLNRSDRKTVFNRRNTKAS